MKSLSLFLISITCLFFAPITSASSKQQATILILGDSLSAGYQMRLEQSWPALLPDELLNHGIDAKVINGSISGDTTGNGLARLPTLLAQHHPDWVVIELGANDGLRGFNPNLIKQNLNQLIDLSQAAGSQVAIMQIRVPPNYGQRYSQMFADIFPQIAKQRDLPLLPFFLEQVIVKPEWMKPDGLHPKAEAQPWIAQFMAQQLQSIL